jgi:hypothetical protein
MGEELTPILVDTKVSQDAHIVIKAMITNVYVDEQLVTVFSLHKSFFAH